MRRRVESAVLFAVGAWLVLGPFVADLVLRRVRHGGQG